MQTPEGLSLGPGCFVTGLEYSADIKAEVVGKPQASFFSMALEKLNSKLSIKLDPKGKLFFGRSQACFLTWLWKNLAPN